MVVTDNIGSQPVWSSGSNFSGAYTQHLQPCWESLSIRMLTGYDQNIIYSFCGGSKDIWLCLMSKSLSFCIVWLFYSAYAFFTSLIKVTLGTHRGLQSHTSFSLSLFSASIEIIIWLLFFNLLMWCITLIDWWILKNPCIPGIKPTWSWCMIFLMCCWILIARILLRILASMFISDLGL